MRWLGMIVASHCCHRHYQGQREGGGDRTGAAASAFGGLCSRGALAQINPGSRLQRSLESRCDDVCVYACVSCVCTPRCAPRRTIGYHGGAQAIR
jgi:hypothetical protein